MLPTIKRLVDGVWVFRWVWHTANAFAHDFLHWHCQSLRVDEQWGLRWKSSLDLHTLRTEQAAPQHRWRMDAMVQRQTGIALQVFVWLPCCMRLGFAHDHGFFLCDLCRLGGGESSTTGWPSLQCAPPGMKFPRSSRRKHSNSSGTTCPTSSCLWSHCSSCYRTLSPSSK